MISAYQQPRTLSRPSSRVSLNGRATSPAFGAASLDDPGTRTTTGMLSNLQYQLKLFFVVALRQQMSNLRHSIRQQTAQLHNLESIVLRGPRPLPPGMINSPPPSPTDSFFQLSTSHRASDMQSPNSMSNANKRNSREHLYGLAGPESSLPLPRRDPSRTRNVSGGGLDDGMDGIKEGIPSSFGSTSSAHLHTPKRQSSPTRSLSRASSFHITNTRITHCMHHRPQEYLSRL